MPACENVVYNFIYCKAVISHWQVSSSSLASPQSSCHWLGVGDVKRVDLSNVAKGT